VRLAKGRLFLLSTLSFLIICNLPVKAGKGAKECARLIHNGSASYYSKDLKEKLPPPSGNPARPFFFMNGETLKTRDGLIYEFGKCLY
jgi:hypothetical protein